MTASHSQFSCSLETFFFPQGPLDSVRGAAGMEQDRGKQTKVLQFSPYTSNGGMTVIISCFASTFSSSFTAHHSQRYPSPGGCHLSDLALDFPFRKSTNSIWSAKVQLLLSRFSTKVMTLKGPPRDENNQLPSHRATIKSVNYFYLRASATLLPCPSNHKSMPSYDNERQRRWQG